MASLTAPTAAPALAAVCDPGGGGSGTDEDPFLISSQAQLEAVNSAACLATGLHFKQTVDIALTGTWSPIGDPADIEYFRGSYDGNNMTIRGLVVTGSTYGTGNRGLFGSVRAGVIRNLQVEEPSVVSDTSDTLVGTVAGHVWGGQIENVRVIGGSVKGRGRVGGLVGGTEPLDGTRAVVSNSSSSASVEETGDWSVGGLIGFARGTDVVRSYATGSVKGTLVGIGGLVGEVDPYEGPPTSACRGSSILDSYALGSVSGDTTFIEGIGGLVGLLRSYASYSCLPELTNVYATGSVNSAGPEPGGGLAGKVTGLPDSAGAPSVSDSYWNTETSGKSNAWPSPPDVSGVLGKTTVQMKDIATYANWSIASSWSPTTTWVICSSFNSGYPHLASFFNAADAPCIDLPGVPDAPTAVAGDGSATITATAGSGGTAASMSISATSGSHSCTITGTSGSCTITGLENGTTYTFTATGRNSAGDSIASTASAPVTPSAAPIPPSPDPEPSVSPAPAPPPAPSASSPKPAENTPAAETPQVQDSIPPSNLPPGSASMLIGGQSATIEEQALRRGQGLSLSAGPVAMNLRSTTPSGRPVPLAPDSSLLLARSGDLPITASGLAPDSIVTQALFSDPIELGTATADAAGKLASDVRIPATVPLGSHTLQLQGTTKTGEAFTLNVGVTVTTPAVALGANPILTVKQRVIKGERALDLRIRGVQARCLVTFSTGDQKIKDRANRAGKARAHLTPPRKSKRTVTVTARVTGKGCAPVKVTRRI